MPKNMIDQVILVLELSCLCDLKFDQVRVHSGTVIGGSQSQPFFIQEGPKVLIFAPFKRHQSEELFHPEIRVSSARSVKA